MNMYEIYYYNQGVYQFQKNCSSYKEAKEKYNESYKGYIKKGNRILKRYTGK